MKEYDKESKWIIVNRERKVERKREWEREWERIRETERERERERRDREYNWKILVREEEYYTEYLTQCVNIYQRTFRYGHVMVQKPDHRNWKIIHQIILSFYIKS